MQARNHTHKINKIERTFGITQNFNIKIIIKSLVGIPVNYFGAVKTTFLILELLQTI